MLSRILVGLWLVCYGRFRLRGAGLLIRLFYPISPGLKAYPLEVPGVGTVRLDFAEGMAYGLLLRFKLRDQGTDAGLYRALENFLGPGAVLWDVGAFAGYISAHFADPRFQLAAIEAFEPNPAALTHLRRFFAQCSLVRIHPFALGAEDKLMELSVPAGGPSMASLVQTEGRASTASVQVRRGDAARRDLQIPLPDVIKIDVEGFEAEVIAGLGDTISGKRPIIVFEHIFLSEKQIHEIVPSSYQLLFLGDDGVVYGGISARGKGHDALLVPVGDERLRRLQPVES